MKNRDLFAVVAITFFVAVSSAYAQTTDFFDLVKSGTLNDIRAAIIKGADANARDSEGDTPLMIAAKVNRNSEVISTLIKAGAIVNTRDEKGESAIFLVAGTKSNSVEVLKLLLISGAKVNARDANENTPLMEAAENQPPEAITTLLNAGADVNALNVVGYSPLMFAVYNQPPEVIAILLKAGAHVNIQSQFGYTPLMNAARYNKNPKVITMLIGSGADVNARVVRKESPQLPNTETGEDFVAAVEKARAEEVQRNGLGGVLPDAGGTPLILAAKYNQNPEMIMSLLKAGADAKAEDKDGHTAIDYARNNEKLKGTKAYWALNDAQY